MGMTRTLPNKNSELSENALDDAAMALLTSLRNRSHWDEDTDLA